MTRAATTLTWVLLAGACPAVSLAQPSVQHEHGHPPADEGQPADHAAPLPPHVPPLTDEDRAAAFPDVGGHTPAHGGGITYFVLADRLEWRPDGDGSTVGLATRGWIGGDISRFWFRAEGDGAEGRVDSALVHALYGRMVATWWDVVVGVRQDVRPASPRTWAAVGIQGLAPYRFEVEATAYVNASGDTHFRFETEYELLLTNRLVLQPLVEADFYGRSDPGRGIGRGLSSVDLALRLRYEVRREFAPYVGVVWSRKYFGTADQATAAGGRAGSARLAMGVRFWF